MSAALLLPLLAIALLVLANGVFVAAEFSLVASRRGRLQALAEQGEAAAKRLLASFERPDGKDAWVATAQLGITLASIGLGMYAEPAVASWLSPALERLGLQALAGPTLGFVLALGLVTWLHVVLGEMIPKALALQAPELISVRIHGLMRLAGLLLHPMVWTLNRLALGLMRLLGIHDPGKAASLYTSRELSILVEEVAESGQLGSIQRTLINNLLELEDRSVEELMTSRVRMEALDVNIAPEELFRRIALSRTSRYPVYEGSLDQILGVLHVKDVIRARARRRPVSLRALVRPLPTVPTSATAEDLLSIFKTSRVHAALVVDEFGGTLGFVTMNDLVADVFEDGGNSSSNWIRRNEDGSYLLDGEVTLAELREDHGIDLDHGEVVTVAGLVLVHHGMLPRVGVTVVANGHRLRVEEMQGMKILRVHLTPRPADPAPLSAG